LCVFSRAAQFRKHEIRGPVDNRNETIGKKIRDAEMQKIPFMLIVGEEEEKNGTILSVATTGRKRKHQRYD
jgi:threonyl-tRNA synthetase